MIKDENMKQTPLRTLLYMAFALLALRAGATERLHRPDSARRFVHHAAAEFRGGGIFRTNGFLAGDNASGSPLRRYASLHLKYALGFAPGSAADRLYGGAVQGVGLAAYAFGNRRELGAPVAAYLFQGARVVRLSPSLSLNYEWNFGLSWGWRPYDASSNPYNVMIGSRVNAYINTNFFLDWRLSPRCRLQAGVDLAHFSNGNTRLPNAGLNVAGAKLGLLCLLSPPSSGGRAPSADAPLLPAFRRHVSYDVVLFGSWRRKLYRESGSWHLSPKAYGVLGAGLSAMWNPGRKARVGGAFDIVYDASSNEFYAHDPSASDGFLNPPLTAKIAIGLSARAEYVMPCFTVGAGLGANVLHRGGELKAFYQMLYLKIAVTRAAFLHVGYRLQEFNTPNYLMLGFGFRLNDKR